MIHPLYPPHKWTFAIVGTCMLFAACGDDSADDIYAEDKAILIGDVRANAKEGDTESFTGADAAALTSDDFVNFNQTALGSSSTRTLLIRNTGKSNLRIDKLALEETKNPDRDNDPREIVPVGESTTAYFKALREGKRIFIAPNSQMEIDIQWSPQDVFQDSGTLTINSNDPLNRTKVVTIQTQELAPDIEAEQVIRFPRVPAGQQISQITYIQNSGQSALQLTDISLSPQGTKDFKISFPEDLMDPQNLMKQSKSWRPSIQPFNEAEPEANKIPMLVTFTPQEDTPKTAKIVISSNDPDQRKFTILLEGNADSPCILLSGATRVPKSERLADETHVIDFGQSQISRDNKKTITVKNCSEGKDLEIKTLALLMGDEKFDADVFDISKPLEKDADRDVIIIPKRESREFEVSYTPTGEFSNIGRILIDSNDEANGAIRINLRGKGTNNVCPVAVANAALLKEDGSPLSVPSDFIKTIPLKTIKLYSGESRDPDGNNSALRYEWNVRSRPSGSEARLSPEGTAKEPSFFLDLAGKYVFELNVYDELGQQSCEPALVTVESIPDEDIHIQLVWKTPTDRDSSDTAGTDLDLHYLHPSSQGVWNDEQWDVYWRQKTQDWGQKGDETDDPSLDIDDTDGFGPENVNHDNPTSGKDYSVGVYYYNDDGYGASYATVRIYIEGELKYETPSQYMQEEDTFWYVATISWPSKQILAKEKIGPGVQFKGIGQ